MTCGTLRAAGGGIVDGVSTIRLSGRPGATTMTFWVDATTYLPVRIVQVWASAPYSDGDVQMDMRWLPATPANKALLTAPIPAGFTHVPWR